MRESESRRVQERTGHGKDNVSRGMTTNYPSDSWRRLDQWINGYHGRRIKRREKRGGK